MVAEYIRIYNVYTVRLSVKTNSNNADISNK